MKNRCSFLGWGNFLWNWKCFACFCLEPFVGLTMQMQNAAFCELNASPGPEGSLEIARNNRNAFRLNASDATPPPPTWQRSQNPPRLKKSKKSLRESLWGSLQGSWPTPQNESKTSLQRQNKTKNHLFFDSGDSFFFGGGGVGQDPRRLPQRLSQRLVFDFLSQGGF